MIFSENILFRLPNGERLVSEYNMQTTIHSLLDELEGVTGLSREQLLIVTEAKAYEPDEYINLYEGQEIWVDYRSAKAQDEPVISKNVQYRDYYHKVSATELKDIKFILKTLAQKSLTALWSYKGELESAGDRIDHLHPLRFLQCIFTNNELIVYVQNIKSRGGWVWSEFVAGFKKSLQEEKDAGNFDEDFIEDFTKDLKLDLRIVYEKYKKNEWENFIKALIANVQRDGEPGRHDQ